MIGIKVTKCNGGCRSCYEERIRSHGSRKYDIKAIMRETEKYLEADKSRGAPTLHGGEPLLMRIRDIEKLLKYIHGKRGHTGIQTGGGLIRPSHIKLFKKYKTSVGISLDGDTVQLNRGRWNKEGIPDTRIEKETGRVLSNIGLLKSSGISMSIISVLRKYNAGPQNVDEFIRFLKRMKSEFGIKHFRTNPGIVFEDCFRESEELTNVELTKAFKKIADITLEDPELYIRPVRDITELLSGMPGSGTCIFMECDPFRTTAEIPVLEDGMLGSCLKSGAGPDGVTAMRADKHSRIRYSVLEQLEKKYLGCKDCRYWSICHGGCPGEGVDNDWRNRSRFCQSYYYLYKYIEDRIRGLFPNAWLTTDGVDTRSGFLESLKTSVWEVGKKTTLANIKKHYRPSGRGSRPDHGDRAHGDGYADSNRPESLIDPMNNKMRPLKK